jgi:hypothetical protein
MMGHTGFFWLKIRLVAALCKWIFRLYKKGENSLVEEANIKFKKNST